MDGCPRTLVILDLPIDVFLEAPLEGIPRVAVVKAVPDSRRAAVSDARARDDTVEDLTPEIGRELGASLLLTFRPCVRVCVATPVLLGVVVEDGPGIPVLVRRLPAPTPVPVRPSLRVGVVKCEAL